MGWATIEGVHESGRAEGDEAALIFDLTVDVPGRDRYRTAHTQIVSRRALEWLRPGVRVPVRVGPDAPVDLLIS